jgi:thermostable 8-oxoguanine DNA glycosylase
MKREFMIKISDTSIDWEKEIAEAENKYNYQPVLTNKLDNIIGDFKNTDILEIVLWKINRYPSISAYLLRDINDLRSNYSIEKARAILKDLLSEDSRGFDLPMASTILRFACPEHLQIIDKRVYRLITPEKDEFKIPYNSERKIELYFDYLRRLKEICIHLNIPFSKADRILYQIDKDLNKDFPINY